MAAQTPTTIKTQHVLGDLVFRTYTLGTTSDGDTLAISETNVEFVGIMPTTVVAGGAIGTTISNVSTTGCTLTFHSGASTWAGVVGVWARIR